jgi:probable HAF family extracellular repeat protein
MRTRIPALLLAPLFLLMAGCNDHQLLTPPEEASFHHRPGHGGGEGDSGGETAKYTAILLEGTHGIAFDINDAGVVVGIDDLDAVRWTVSSAGISGPEKLGTLPFWGPQFPVAVNAGGTIVGWAEPGGNRKRAFVYTDEVGMQLLPRPGDADQSRALAINDQGIAVGTIGFTDEEGIIIKQDAAVWLNATDEPILLPPLDGHSHSSASVINNDGLIAGESGGRTVTWRISDTGELLEGPLPLEDGFAIESRRLYRVFGAMNNHGDIAGSQWQDGKVVAALMREGVVTLLGSRLPDESSEASGINDSSADGMIQIVGSSEWWAMLWTVDAGGNVEGPVDIGAPSRSINAQALQINGQGWIVGRSASRSNANRATLWLPQEDDGGDGDGDNGDDDDDECIPHPSPNRECR